jgi:hypothetical protein
MRTFSLILITAACVGLAMRAPASANNIPSGSFSDTCNAIQVIGDNLNANCEDISGNWHLTQADIGSCPSRSFANVDGGLVCGRGGYGISQDLPLGSWRASCSTGSKNNGILSANCDTGSGSWRDSSLNLNDCPGRVVDNNNGYLVCRAGANDYTPNWLPNRSQNDQPNQGQNYGNNQRSYGLPGGSWQTTCRNANIQGSMLYAQCDNGSGSWVQAQFDLSRAPGAQLGNDHGVLLVSGQP